MTRKDPLKGLEKIPWRRLRTASPGHRATKLPEVLRGLARTREPARWLEVFTALPSLAYLSHGHGPYVSEAAARAVPFVVALLPLAPDGDCLGCLLMELEAICAGVVHTREDLLASYQDLSWPLDESSLPTEEESQQQRRILERARMAVRRELPRILVYLDHPLPWVRSQLYALLQALPEERALFEPLLWKRLEREPSLKARAVLLLALDGEVTSRSTEPHLMRLPVELLLRFWRSKRSRETRFVVAYLLVLRLGDQAPAGCFLELARAMGEGGVLLGHLRFSPGYAASRAYLPLRSEPALLALLEALEAGRYQAEPGAIALLLHALSGSDTPSPWCMIRLGSPPHRLIVPRERLKPFPRSPRNKLRERLLGYLASSEWFWSWGGAMLKAYGLPGTRRGLDAWLARIAAESVAQEPRLGIYWLLEGKVEAFSQPMSEVRAVGGFRDADLAHAEVWRQVVARHPELGGLEYFAVPRGRVLYVEETGVFRVFMPSREAKNPQRVQQVIAAFALPAAKVQVAHDRHYEPPGPDLFGPAPSRRRR